MAGVAVVDFEWRYQYFHPIEETLLAFLGLFFLQRLAAFALPRLLYLPACH
jgi:hypothetical protein